MKTDGWKRKEAHKLVLALVKWLKWELLSHPPRLGCLRPSRHLVRHQTQPMPSPAHLTADGQSTGDILNDEKLV